MATVNDVPRLVDKKGGSYAAIAPKLDPRKFNKWKKRMICYLAGIELYYLKCIKDGPFQPKTAEGDAKPESQWTLDERRVLGQDQHLKIIIMSCLPDDVMESFISCVSAKETWTGLVHSFEESKDLTTKEQSLVAEIFDWDEEEVFEDKEVTQFKVDITIRKVNTLLSMDEDADWQNYLKYINIDLKFVEDQRLKLLHKYNKIVFELNKCIDELLRLKQAKLDAVTFQIQNTELTKSNHALQEQLKEEKKINEKWLTSSKKVSQCISKQIPHQKQKVIGDELLTESLSKININENALILASMGRILVPESQAVNESLETLNTSESSKDSEAEFLTSLPPLKNLQRTSPSLEIMPFTFQPHSPKKRPGLGIMKHTKPETQDSSNKSVSETATVSRTKRIKPSVPTEVKDTEQESKLNKLTKLVQMLIDEKILKPKAKPFLPCTHCGFNDHEPDDYRNYPECEICGSYDHFTLGHNRVIHFRGGVLAELSQSNESLFGVKCNTCGSTIHSTSDHNEFDHFKSETHQEPIWYMDSGCSRSMTGVKSYLYKYVEQPGPKVVFGDNSSCIIE
uniref:Retrovirus-related Pol polyprotein from transposon TNT 1-94 n=1 Tax=Tanacetum cinerariifolium TaxID=118510 RepID=A0A6L2NLX1_TANCI|nr:retrovirus-related Pol polyprotein from transposon TNT 1-94 [Tanacetum cinerariifolium]